MNKTVEFFDNVVKGLNIDPGNPQSIEMFGDRRFHFNVFLINADGDMFKIARTSIDELYIVDDIADWFHYGHLIFTNPKDVLERGVKAFGPDGKEITLEPFRFRNDGRDYVYISMDPAMSDGNDNTPVEPMESIVHSMRFLFTVYGMEDVAAPDGSNNKKQKLYLRDYRLQNLLEKNLYYSTAKTPLKLGQNTNVGTNTKQQNNSDRSKTTGEVIQDILVACLQESDTKNLFSRNWEFGDQQIFYTSPANHKAFDDLSYVLDRHVSSEEHNHEPCIFRLQRYSDRWELLPMSKFFERSHQGNLPGPYQSEKFLLTMDFDTHTGGVPPASKTYDAGNVMINYHYPDLSIINDYTFTEMNGADCQSILNSTIVHRYDEDDKTFSVDLVESNIKHVHDMFQEKYVSHMKGSSGEGFTAWLTDTSREQNRNISVVESWTPNSILGLRSRNKKLMAGMLLGNGIQFEVKGHTSRRSGVWMSLDMDMPYEETTYDKKVLGQYFTVRTTHRITSTEYSNNITAVKPYYFDDPGFNNGDIFFKETEKLFESK